MASSSLRSAATSPVRPNRARRAAVFGGAGCRVHECVDALNAARRALARLECSIHCIGKQPWHAPSIASPRKPGGDDWRSPRPATAGVTRDSMNAAQRRSRARAIAHNEKKKQQQQQQAQQQQQQPPPSMEAAAEGVEAEGMEEATTAATTAAVAASRRPAEAERGKRQAVAAPVVAEPVGAVAVAAEATTTGVAAAGVAGGRTRRSARAVAAGVEKPPTPGVKKPAAPAAAGTGGAHVRALVAELTRGGKALAAALAMGGGGKGGKGGEGTAAA
jgi:hypothetical protein